jgi:epoxyqueuosine reductase
MKGRFDDWLFGCDTCQAVCPWNRFSVPHHEERFTPLNEILQFSLNDWAALTEDSFRTIFRHSPLKRAKLKGIHRNLIFLNNTVSNVDPTSPVTTD